MPWNVVKGDDRCPGGKPYAVVGGAGGNKLFGCHPDKDSARRQQQALYAQADDTKGCPPMDTQRDDYPVAYTTPCTVAW
jgi:hypothetical protein